MGLDYSGKPKKPFNRELNDPLNRLARDPGPLFEQEKPGDKDDQLFDDIAKVYIKGDKLKKGLAEMDKAAWIPVEDGADVSVSIQRVAPDLSDDIITFGLFKEACEFISGRAQSLDEEFIANFDVIDVSKINRTVVRKFKGQDSVGSDWITQFLEALSPFAGVMLAGYFVDLAHSNSNKVPVPDGSNSGTQPQTYHAQGLPVGVALLIELGMTLGAFKSLFGESPSGLTPEVENTFTSLMSSGSKRREVLESAGMDYDKIQKNRKYDDYCAIKRYSIDYIASLSDNLKYDHWLAWLNVSDNQSMLRGAMGMAPMYSKKWKSYYDSGDVKSFKSEIEPDSDIEKLAKTAASGMIAGMRSYFSTLLTISNDNYDKTFQVYSMQLDDRLMCCILWYLGPLEPKTLDGISNILRLLALQTRVNPDNMLAFLAEGAGSAILNMLSVYSNRLINELYNEIMEKLFAIPEAEWQIAVKYCIGIEVLFKLIGKAFDNIIELVTSILEELEAGIDIHINKRHRAFIQVSAERKYLVSMAALIDAIRIKFEFAQQKCMFGDLNDPQKINDLAADAAVDFVATELPKLYPVLDLPETTRRKFFSEVQDFETEDIGLPVPGYDELGRQKEITREDSVFECGEGNRAVEGLSIGKRLADIMEGRS